ncbi:MAG: hypothetical protein EXS18_05565 [Verrucomicrobiae bacterium]|nr:hypothetical protein [Verrucomicrobiae bacterium]
MNRKSRSRHPKFYILTDLEGPAGVSLWSQTREASNVNKLFAMDLLTEEVNAAVEGILDVHPLATVHCDGWARRHGHQLESSPSAGAVVPWQGAQPARGPRRIVRRATPHRSARDGGHARRPSVPHLLLARSRVLHTQRREDRRVRMSGIAGGRGRSPNDFPQWR